MATETDDERMRRLTRNKPLSTLPKRFYKSVTVGPDLQVLLDGRPVKTPMKAVLSLPSAPLAQAVADEWQAQVEVIDPHSMPLTKLANTAIDRAGPHAKAIRDDLLAYAANDLVFYRVSQPEDLVERQDQLWNPVLDWARESLAARFEVTDGLSHKTQPPEALQAISRRLQGLDPAALVGLHNMTTLSGSLLLALMASEGVLSPAQAWQAATVEEAYQAEKWGQDSEALDRDRLRAAEFTHSANFVNLAKQGR